MYVHCTCTCIDMYTFPSASVMRKGLFWKVCLEMNSEGKSLLNCWSHNCQKEYTYKQTTKKEELSNVMHSINAIVNQNIKMQYS